MGGNIVTYCRHVGKLRTCHKTRQNVSFRPRLRNCFPSNVSNCRLRWPARPINLYIRDKREKGEWIVMVISSFSKVSLRWKILRERNFWKVRWSESEQWEINPKTGFPRFLLNIPVKMAVKETLNRDIFSRPTRQRLIGIVNRRGRGWILFLEIATKIGKHRLNLVR